MHNMNPYRPAFQLMEIAFRYAAEEDYVTSAALISAALATVDRKIHTGLFDAVHILSGAIVMHGAAVREAASVESIR